MRQVRRTFGADAVNRFGFLFVHVSALEHYPDVHFKVEAKNYAGVALSDEELDLEQANIDYSKADKIDTSSDDLSTYKVFEFPEKLPAIEMGESLQGESSKNPFKDVALSDQDEHKLAKMVASLFKI